VVIPVIRHEEVDVAVGTLTQQQTPTPITAARALTTAEADAAAVYGDLTPFLVQLRLEPDGWHVDYELADQNVQGGGPHYVIDPSDGRIVRKRYEQ